MFNYSVINPPDFFIDENIIKDIFKIVEKTEIKKQNGTLNLVFVNSDTIRELNKKYRNIESSTDVLSFHYYDDFLGFKKDDIVGELIFCIEKIVSQGEEDGLGSEKDFYMLLIHSILHVLGYDHEKECDYKIMHKKEKLVWDKIF